MMDIRAWVVVLKRKVVQDRVDPVGFNLQIIGLFYVNGGILIMTGVVFLCEVCFYQIWVIFTQI